MPVRLAERIWLLVNRSWELELEAKLMWSVLVSLVSVISNLVLLAVISSFLRVSSS